MRIDETIYKAMPTNLQALFRKLPNPGSDEVLAAFPQAQGAVSNGKRKGNGYGEGFGGMEQAPSYGDTGSAARFFYCAKASKRDRGDGNNHPTVKPTDMMRYLVRLVTPPGGLVLDPFMGSGSTGKAAALEGFRFVGCELSEEYIRIAQARISGVNVLNAIPNQMTLLD